MADSSDQQHTSIKNQQVSGLDELNCVPAERRNCSTSSATTVVGNDALDIPLALLVRGHRRHLAHLTKCPLAATSICRLRRTTEAVKQVIGVSHVRNAGNASVAGREKETQVKLQRTGFFLVADYASTAHMIQGISIRESCLLAVVAPAGTLSTSCY